MAKTPRSTMRIIGRKRGGTDDDKKNRISVNQDQYPELMAALKAYFDKNPDVGRLMVRAEGD